MMSKATSSKLKLSYPRDASPRVFSPPSPKPLNLTTPVTTTTTSPAASPPSSPLTTPSPPHPAPSAISPQFQSLPHATCDSDPHKMAPQKSATKPARQSPQTKMYLLLYNFNNACLWTIVLGRLLYNIAFSSLDEVESDMGSFVRFTQSIALLEIFHSIFGKHPPARNSPNDDRTCSGLV